ncbi:enhancer of mRNA-decapping protein 4-like isoform X2 [Galleria mellonella]|uniref:Enhancer of mRNA-decapping protein 4-like isoform X2 n=1 Tax=Galleria mellonella TaxID=7137 RepID=A0ABM3N2U9_GALME|nr:enhancer of mRNA-decapping protein 4-like isoform X2 [Galleria mellonella]
MDNRSVQNDEHFLERSKSLSSLDETKENTSPSCKNYGRRISDSSVEIYIINDYESDSSLGDRCKHMQDSGIGEKLAFHNDRYTILEKKLERLNDLFQKQCSLLNAIQEGIRDLMSAIEKSGQLNNQFAIDITNKFFNQSKLIEQANIQRSDGIEENTNIRAKSLLDAIEFKQGHSLDREIRDAMTRFLQSDDLKERILAATANSVKAVIESCITNDMSTLYLPVLERSHRRLVAHVTNLVEGAFAEKENTGSLTKHAHKTWRALRRALDQHQHLLRHHTNRENLLDTLQHTVEELFKNELKEWRQKVLDVISTNASDCVLNEEKPPTPPLECALTSLPQPADPELSIIDQLMQSAEITKLIEDGDVNGSFEKALSASDLSLVMVACRAADPVKVFATPCKLKQSVLLSLMQQLATDMVHDTQLKCRYLEDAIIHLNTADPATRAYLPLVVGEVRRHLKKFLKSYPSHLASRRVTLIIMASDNLLQ